MHGARLLALGVVCYLLLATLLANVDSAFGIDSAFDVGRAWRDRAQDFSVFYNAGLQLREESGEGLYEFTGFFQPPFAALVYVPLTFFDFETANRINLILQVVSAVALIGLAWCWGARRLELLLVTLALASFTPLQYSLVWGQPAAALALLGALALIALERRPNAPTSWLIASLLVFKPPLLAVPGLTLLLREQWRPLAGVIVLAALLVALPFLVIGLDEADGFVSRTLGIAGDGFRARPELTTPAATLHNWNGVVARLWRDGQLLLPTLALDIATLVLGVKAIRQGSLREGWLAATAVMLFVTPHVHFHQWLVLFGPSVAAYLERRSPALAVLLLGLHFSLLLSALFWGQGVLSGLWAPGLLGVLAYLAFRERAEALFEAIVRPLLAPPLSAPSTQADSLPADP